MGLRRNNVLGTLLIYVLKQNRQIWFYHLRNEYLICCQQISCMYLQSLDVAGFRYPYYYHFGKLSMCHRLAVLNVLCSFNLRPVSTGNINHCKNEPFTYDSVLLRNIKAHIFNVNLSLTCVWPVFKIIETRTKRR